MIKNETEEAHTPIKVESKFFTFVALGAVLLLLLCCLQLILKKKQFETRSLVVAV